MLRILFTLLFLAVLAPLSAQLSQMQVRWKVIHNNHAARDLTLSEFTFTNRGKTSIPDTSWEFYFCFIRPIISDSLPAGFSIENLNGDFFRLKFKRESGSIAPGQSVRVPIISSYWAFMHSDFPRGTYFTEADKIIPVNLITDYPENPRQTSANKSDKRPVETPEIRFERNARLSLLSTGELPPFLPSPASWTYGKGKLLIQAPFRISFESGLESTAGYVSDLLMSIGIHSMQVTSFKEVANSIHLSLDPRSPQCPEKESYQLLVDAQKGIRITGHDQAGLFYGVQSLRSLLLKDKNSLPELRVNDVPRFGYRGVMLDVARNFQSKESVMHLLDLMAFYKFNKLQFHLTDDEGWRVEINGIPELTSYGAFRGHTEDESEFLQPFFGSGPYTETSKSTGSGFYNRSSFIEILQYASERNIEIIPELDFPGHARAAIKAMDYRYRKYMAMGQPEEARRYLLRDTSDLSVYTSVQGYRDNVICVCNESVYQFLKKVIQELANTYRDAGVPLRTLHMGGDEVPAGAWEKSPACQAFLESHPEYPDAHSLQSYFTGRFTELLLLKGIVPAGWEEIAIKMETNGKLRGPVARKELLGRDLYPFCWNSLWQGGGEDLSYKLANAGFKVVQANATNLYLDMAYCKDPREPGFYWANYVNTNEVFSFAPYRISGLPAITKMGDTLSAAGLTERLVQLTDAGKNRITGIQACLFGENITSREIMEYMLFPRLIAVAERAWSPEPEWESMPYQEKKLRLLENDYNRFANMLGQKELFMLNRMGIRFRIPLPGARKSGNVLLVNTEFPGLPVQYTTDGSEPTLRSPKSAGTIRKTGGIKLASILPDGRKSRVVDLK